MKRAILAMLVTFLPVAVAAQDSPASGGDTSVTSPVPDRSAPAADEASQGRAGRGGPPRRGSMVGYIEDATIGSGLRVRFDSGWDMTSPDRAEFFYAKCGCYRDFTDSPAADPNAPGPGPGVVQNMNYNQLNLMTERQISKHASIIFDLPFRWIKPTDFVAGTGSFGNQSGIGDITVGTKVAIATSSSHDITVMVRGSIPTGDSSKGLGTDHGSIEPALLVRQSLGGRAEIEGQFGYWHPTGSSQGPLPGSGNFSGDILYYGIGPSFNIVNKRNARFAPVVELVGWHLLGGFETSAFFVNGTSGDVSGMNIVNLKVGARLALKTGSVYVGYGWALTNNAWYDHILRLEYRAKI